MFYKVQAPQKNPEKQSKSTHALNAAVDNWLKQEQEIRNQQQAAQALNQAADSWLKEEAEIQNPQHATQPSFS